MEQTDYFVQIPDRLIMDRSVSSEGLRLFLVLRTWGRNKPTICAGNTAIAKRFGCSVDHARRAIRKLEAAGWIERFYIGPDRHIRLDPKGGARSTQGGREVPRGVGAKYPGKGGREVPTEPEEENQKKNQKHPSLFDHQEKKKAKAVPKQTATDHLKADFAAWWLLYPRKVSKGGARKAFKTARKTASQAELMTGVEALSSKIVRDQTETQFIPHPATWLNGERWADVETAETPDEARYRSAFP